MEKHKKISSSRKTPPSTAKVLTAFSPSTSRIPTVSDKKQSLDYSFEIEKWISLFKNLNSSLEQLYFMCSSENITAFTQGVIDSLKHSLDQFNILISKQQEKNNNVEIADTTGSVDGEILRQYLADGLQPIEALLMIIKEKAAETEEQSNNDETEREENSENSDSGTDSGENVSLFSEEPKRCRSLSPGTQNNINRLKQKLLKDKPSPSEIKEKSEIRHKRAEIKRKMKRIVREELALQKKRKLRKAKECVETQEAEKKMAIELQITLKQRNADERYEAHLNNIRNRAKSENLKTNEVAFILELQAEEKKAGLEEKKMGLDNRISETRERRQKILESIKQKQIDRNLKESAAEKRRIALQNEKGIKYMTSQQKIEEADLRRQQILELKKSVAEVLSKKRIHRSTTSKKRLRKKKNLISSEKEDESWDSEIQSSVDENIAVTNKSWAIEEKNSEDSRKSDREENSVKLWCSVCNFVLPQNPKLEETCPNFNHLIEEHLFSQKHRIELNRGLVQINIPEIVLQFTSTTELINQREAYVKKRLKKIKQLYNSRCLKHEKANIMGKETTGINKNRLQKLSLDLDKYITNFIDYESVANVLKDTIKLLDQRKEADLHVIRQLKFIPSIMEIVKKTWSCPKHEVKYVLNILETVTKFLTIFSGLSENRTYLEVTNRIVPLVDLISWIFNKNIKAIIELSYVPQLFHLLTILLKHRLPSDHRHFRDYFVEYLLNSGLLIKLKQKLSLIQGPLDLTSNNFSLFLLKCVGFLEALTTFPGWGLSDKPAYEVSIFLTDNFLYLLQESDLAGIPYLLLCLLLNENPAKKMPPRVIPQTLLAVAILSIRFLNNLARLHLPLLQDMLSSEEYFDQVYHLFDYILRYASEHLDSGPEDVRELLHELILLIGYFVSMNTKNQGMMNRGETSIIQRLCNLPFAYFGDKKYINVLFPTLISICYDHPHNFSVLSQEISVDLLINYVKQQILLYPIEETGKDEMKKENRSKRSLSISSSNSYSKSVLAAASFKLVFLNRFPRDLWEKALEFMTERADQG